MRRTGLLYAALMGACFFFSVALGWTSLGTQFDNDIYDFLFRLSATERPNPSSILLGIDERSYSKFGGVSAVRRILAEGLPRVAAAKPKAVVVDVILADEGMDPEINRRLAAAFAMVPNLVLATSLTRQGEWETPIPLFRAAAAGLGHVHPDPDGLDQVVRRVSLEKSSGRTRFWALSLETFRIANGNAPVTEEMDEIEVAGRHIHGRRDDARPLWVNYSRNSIPEVTFADLADRADAPARLRGKVVFVGITAQSASPDRHMTPMSYGESMSGIEIHANAFETLMEGRILRTASNLASILFALVLCVAAGVAFWFATPGKAYLAALALMAIAFFAPFLAFRTGLVFPYFQPLAAAGLALGAGATARFFLVRQRMDRAEADKERYQQAIHFVVHEMRTPLSTIQGSSELMGRYKLSDEKRAEMTRTINTESKRLANMIQTFLNVERLSEGQMQLKRELFVISTLVNTCVDRVKPLAERKQITITPPPASDVQLTGDRELMEYAVYNLLTNAIKYSAAETHVTVDLQFDGKNLRLSVHDQGMGMDEQELASIFRKFYRTRKAEASGEVGTGIGLSIVDQIVTNHGGRMEVTSTPGAGSCFTMVVPATVLAGR
jgi:signal transduction histidine kinase